MSDFPWKTFVDRGNLAGSVLNSLADGALSASMTSLDNSANKDTHMIIEVILGSLTPVTPGYLEIYLTKALDGTNYDEAPVIGGLDRNTLIATIPLPAGTGTKRVTTGLISIPPFKLISYVGNKLGVAMASSGNSFKVYSGVLANV